MAVGAAAALTVAAITAAIRGRRTLRPAAVTAVVVVAAAALVVPTVLEGSVVALSRPAPETIAWQRFEQAEIGKLVAEGRTVFVDVTADWCVTCIVNKKLVIDREPVASVLASDDVVAMRADMTRPDAAISAYLAQYDRYGIPFNIVYGPGAPRGIDLPEVLTDDVVTDAFRRASR